MYNDQVMDFVYSGNTPVVMICNDSVYFYASNLQGDIVAILDSNGNPVVEYTYDAWGKILTITGSMASTLGVLNPLRYRGYIYDTELGLYYLQSRYYNPAIGRFLNADSYASTGQGILGNNMFAYCGNNPINRVDYAGTSYVINDRDLVGYGGSTSIYDSFDALFKCYESIPKPNIAISYGRYISFTLGAFNISGTYEKAIDPNGNIQINSSFSFDVTSTGSVSASTGYVGSIFFVPDTSYLAGDTTYLGGGTSIPIPYTPFAATVSANIGQTSDGYWGIMSSAGIAPATSAGGEVHGGYSYTHSWTPQINIFEISRTLIRAIL